MKKKIKEIRNEKLPELNEEVKMPEPNGKKITRAEAIKKAGYIAVSAATMMILLSKPNQAYASPVYTPNEAPAEPAAPPKGIW